MGIVAIIVCVLLIRWFFLGISYIIGLTLDIVEGVWNFLTKGSIKNKMK